MTEACALPANKVEYDVLVVGSGIGGMESALKLGDMGYKVLLVEKEASVGGKMILLSKVFPTLDCASCISTPKMAATIHHPNITALTYSQVDGIRRSADGRFHAAVTRKARFVDIDACTGCQKCETACTVAVPDQFNADLVARRAAHIPLHAIGARRQPRDAEPRPEACGVRPGELDAEARLVPR
jgi:heterodisulfide reductase subunit A